MVFEIRLKTGFFETTAYKFLISKDKLVLSSTESDSNVIKIAGKDIILITLNNEKVSEITIQARDKIYQGVLCKKTDFEKLLELLKKNLSTKIICEYEGGTDNA